MKPHNDTPQELGAYALSMLQVLQCESVIAIGVAPELPGEAGQSRRIISSIMLSGKEGVGIEYFVNLLAHLDVFRGMVIDDLSSRYEMTVGDLEAQVIDHRNRLSDSIKKQATRTIHDERKQ